MINEKKLELTLCGMLPYGLKVNFGEIVGLDLSHPQGKIVIIDNEKVINNIKFSVVDLLKVEPLLHSLDKLITDVLEDENDYFYKLNLELCDILGLIDCEYFVKSLIKKTKYVVGTNIMIEALEFLKENHFNIYDLPKEMYVEKSTINLNLE